MSDYTGVPPAQNKVTILLVGSGGREHALAWKLARSPRCERLYVAPGNAGTAAWNVDIDVDDFVGLAEFALEKGVDLTFVGPEGPLCGGIVDCFLERGLRIFGPGRMAARLEGSKAFAKELMARAGIPTAAYRVFDERDDALAYVAEQGAPVVVKADGLAAGKGAVVAKTDEEAVEAVERIMGGGFGAAGKRVVVEEFLVGQEVSFFCLCDGKTALPLMAAQDHKRLLDNDEGPNTGGMGAYGPPVFWNRDLEEEIMGSVVEPTLRAMDEDGVPFMGVLFVGLILTEQGPKVLEYNVRFGDPETQVLMMLLESDLVPILEAGMNGSFESVELSWFPGAAVCVVMASAGYPESSTKGVPVGVPDVSGEDRGEAIFHAATVGRRDGTGVDTGGGRVLGVTARGEDLAQARAQAYALVERIDFPGACFRNDIGSKGLGV
ncbi:MAG: phosphoribosylamine--glycine ligase [Peptococcaceae bacterium]|nr:phosphoribosylamine--glycine ligase [Peptococcaceae bacterium]